MTISFTIVSALIFVSAIAAVMLRKLVHCVLCLALTFTGVAMIYLQLDAEFVGFAQILVYVGAVAILIMFAILLTARRADVSVSGVFSESWGLGLLIGFLVTACLVGAVLQSVETVAAPVPPVVGVQEIGERLMGDYVLPLEVIGLLLTAAMIGAVIIAMPERERNQG